MLDFAVIIMKYFGLVVLWVVGVTSRCSVHPRFPSYFKFGVSTSSYQVEGAWNVSDKGVNIYDTFTHNTPGAIKDNSTGDVACDSYHLWKRDAQMTRELGVDFYRFSISWSRLLPKGFNYYISKDGKKYYNNLINELLKNGVEPMVTLYHWDLPEILQQLGGWTNPLIVDWFADYARVVFSLFGDRVKTWITINEPIVMCDMSYNAGILAPGIKEPYAAAFLCTKHVLLAHAKAWRIYDEEFRDMYDGKISISNQLVWYEPKSPEHEELAELALQYVAGRFSHAIYSDRGGWHPDLEDVIEEASKKMGYSTSRLPSFTDDEIDLIRGTYDFYAFNYYSGLAVRPANPGEEIKPIFFSGIPELNLVMEPPPDATYGFHPDMVSYPKGLRKMFNWLAASYGDIEMVVTENGFSTHGSSLNDKGRIDYIRNHLEQILLAIKKDDLQVTGYTHWSLMDNFEWMEGYVPKFGLYEVNFTDPKRTRTPRASAKYYSSLIKGRKLDICK